MFEVWAVTKENEKMYESICYDASFLKEVVVRVDFSSPVEALATSLPLKVGNGALQRFPINEPRQALAQELQLTGNEIRHSKQEFTEWNFWGRDREKRLSISPAAAFASYSHYSSYEGLKEDFLFVLELLFTALPDLRAARLGLRYINNIEPQGGDPFSWDEYIDERLLGLFTRFANREQVTRLFNIAEFKHDDLQVRFQFGVPNPDFPAIVRRPLFVIDIDAYVVGLQTLEDVRANLDRAHERGQMLFEESITDRLREVMRARRV